MSSSESGCWKKMLYSIIYLKALCSYCFSSFISFTLFLLLCPRISCGYLPTHHISFHPFFFVCLSSSFSPTHRPSRGGAVPCTRAQPETGSPEGDAECWSRVGSWSWWFPPQWRSYSTQGLSGRAARTSAHTQTLSGSPEDWRWLLTLTHTLFTLRLLHLLSNWPCP